MAHLRYTKRFKESGWVTRTFENQRMSTGQGNHAHARKYFKLRGGALTVLNEDKEEEWRSAIMTVLAGEENTLSISFTTEQGTITVKADSREDYLRWFRCLSAVAGQSFGKYYQLGTCLAGGTSSLVHHVMDRRNKDQLVVKIIQKDKCGQGSGGLFVRREVKALCLTDHPNIVRAIDVFSVDDKPHLVLEYVQHGTLQDLINNNPRGMNEVQARCIIQNVIKGLVHLHQKNILHRDLNPSNILMVSDFNAKIADFGLATFLADRDNKPHKSVGTLRYMAPEVLVGEPYGKPVDCWSIGIIYFTMIFGHNPFRGNTKKEMLTRIGERTESFLEFCAALVEPKLSDFVDSLLTIDPNSRISAEDALVHEYFRIKLDSSRSEGFNTILSTLMYR